MNKRGISNIEWVSVCIVSLLISVPLLIYCNNLMFPNVKSSLRAEAGLSANAFRFSGDTCEIYVERVSNNYQIDFKDEAKALEIIYTLADHSGSDFRFYVTTDARNRVIRVFGDHVIHVPTPGSLLEELVMKNTRADAILIFQTFIDFYLAHEQRK